ncbi:hypothetical protein [Microbacterium elymi]|uniref:NYN domain-containing protein n=1 Tax=Microbacterium elymi TaxID=2909587 RepID=A0ABY5NMM1_9MICO|nr:MULTISPECIES: hypothetical protein [Microbacterium]UUT36420.1 hypothetical protein L2X98_26230 [Microbacterium elymi]
MPDLRAAVIIDYQNVHLTGVGLFEHHQPPHEHLVHPLHFANQLITRRNSNQREGRAHATLRKVLVYRGLPSADIDPKAYARNLAQKAHWEQDPRVSVTLRPLKYRYARAQDGRKATDAAGRFILNGKPQEKGVDVLCALALVREARDPNIDLVILASQDTDLEPALDEACALQTAKVETVSWFDQGQYRQSREIRPDALRIWNTRLNAQAFSACRDPEDYD